MHKNTPYEVKALDYIMSGWTPLPLPSGEKFPPPKGYTGGNAIEATEDIMLGEWLVKGGNIAVKLPCNLIGLDIDGVGGYSNFIALQEHLGALPITYIVTNHDNIEDGFTAFFEVPANTVFKGGAAPKIDVIQASHRYQTAPPSIHPAQRVYEWRQWGSRQALPFIPEITSFEPLPVKWLEFLNKPARVFSENIETGGNNVFPGNCAMMNKIVATHIAKLSDRNVPGGRHDKLVVAVWAIVCELHKGHSGDRALEEYRKHWVAKFTPGERDTAAEFAAAVSSAQSKQQGNKRNGCFCGSGRKQYRKPAGLAGLRMWK